MLFYGRIFFMKRLCIFAHWDKDNIIEDYVLYYLSELKKVCSTIIFVSDCDLSNTEISKLQGIADFTIAEKHGEYDFGSYKRGFFFALKQNLEFDELIFANDSCYGPFYQLEPIFTKMEKRKLDYWGLTKNSYGIKKSQSINLPIWNPHIQSYFLVFSRKVFESEVFINFIQSIKKEPDKDSIIINYEVGLSNLLQKSKFRDGVYINRFSHTENPISSKWKKMIKRYKYPFLKTAIVYRGLFVLGEVKDWKEVIKSVSDYPVEFIEKHSKRYYYPEPCLFETFNPYRKIRFRILQNTPMEFRKIVIFCEKYLYKILNTLFFNKLAKF